MDVAQRSHFPSGHLSNCGRDCPGEPACSETADVIAGIGDDERRLRYGALPIDAACAIPGCGSGPGEVCRDPSGELDKFGTRWCHGERAVAAHRMRAAVASSMEDLHPRETVSMVDVMQQDGSVASCVQTKITQGLHESFDEFLVRVGRLDKV